MEKPIVYEYKNKNELKSLLKNKKLIIINSSIISLWPNLEFNSIYYYLYDSKIEFDFYTQDSLVLETDGNIISSKKDNNMKISHLMQLIRIFYFKKFISLIISKEHQMNNDNDSIFLIKKNVINEYTSYFNYGSLFFPNDNIEYKDLENKSDGIVAYLKQNYNIYYEEIILKEKNFSLNFFGNEYYLKSNNYEYKGKKLIYFSDFEIIDKHIYNFFEENKIIKSEQVIICKYIAEDDKIFLHYNLNGKNFYQIVSLDILSENYIIEYIIEENAFNKKIVNEYFNFYGIKEMINRIQDDKILSEYNKIFNCYKVRITNDDINDDIIMQNEQYNINDIILTLITLYKFEEYIKMKLEFSKTGINSNESINPFTSLVCKLVNEKFINEIKYLFNYPKLINIIKTYKIELSSEINDEIVDQVLKRDIFYKKELLEKKNEFLELKTRAVEFYKTQKITLGKGNEKFNYPTKFNFVDGIIYDKFLSILDLKELSIVNNHEDTLIVYNNGNIVFHGVDNFFYGNYLSLIYIYSCNYQEELKTVDYDPVAILDFQDSQNIIK